MPFAAILSAIGGAASALISGVFGLKQSQSEVVKSSLDLMGSIQSDEAKAQVAAMTALVAESQSESWLTRTWRPLAFTGFLVMLFLFFFGMAPTALLGDHLPPLVERIFSLLEVVLLAGYPARTLEKITREINLGILLKTFIEKKML